MRNFDQETPEHIFLKILFEDVEAERKIPQVKNANKISPNETPGFVEIPIELCIHMLTIQSPESCQGAVELILLGPPPNRRSGSGSAPALEILWAFQIYNWHSKGIQRVKENNKICKL